MNPMRVGIVGYGTVGRATAEILEGNAAEIEQRSGVKIGVAAVCRRSPIAKDVLTNGAKTFTDWKQVVFADDVDVVVETMGGTTTARDVVRASLERGKPVVTANKNLVAQFGDELFALAAEKHLPIGFEATVAAGVPVLRSIRVGAVADKLNAVYGIVNGTANYTLTEMGKSGVSFEDALAQAQQAGYAEADPSADVDGLDTRDKLCILARLAFSRKVEAQSIPVEGIRSIKSVDIHYANRLGSVIRLVGAAERNGDTLDLSVRPWLVEKSSMMGKVEGVNNAVFLSGESIGTQVFYGPGAGGQSTGAAVVSDLVDIAQNFSSGNSKSQLVTGFHNAHAVQLCETPRPVGWFLRLTVRDQAGIIARVADVIARQGFNIHSVIQEPGFPKDELSFVVTLEAASEPQVRRAVEEINSFEFMCEPVLLLRVL